MKRILTILIAVAFLSCNNGDRKVSINGDTVSALKESLSWNIDKERIHNSNRKDTTKTSHKNWQADLQQLGGSSNNPMTNGIFPVPEYELIDTTFNGVGNSGDWKGFNFFNKKIIYHSLFVNKYNHNNTYIKEKENEVYFAIAVLTDYVNLKKYDHTNVSITSRNFPHFTGQGFVKTKNDQIDFLAFLTADRNEYAIINMRLFDLRIGRIVIIAPQKDGSLRSLQLEAPIMSSTEMNDYLIHLFDGDTEVREFLSANGNI